MVFETSSDPFHTLGAYICKMFYIAYNSDAHMLPGELRYVLD
jgi:hypothetical protein